jgi:hypothetical protein
MATTDTPATATSRPAPARPVATKRPPVVDRLTGQDLSMLGRTGSAGRRTSA